MASYTSKFARKARTALRTTDHGTARAFLLSKGYACSSFRMPEYYRPGGFEDMHFPPITNWRKVLITKTLDILTPKGSLSWRNFNFANPFIFFQKVEQITHPDNWPAIVDILANDNLVNCYSSPPFSLRTWESVNSKAILNWLQMAEKDCVKDCVGYNYLIVTDIKNFYPSVYTHSISWALHTKSVSKARRNDWTLLGNKLDKLFQNSRDGQTNGIPVGSLASDIIAEVILCDVDRKLSDRIKAERLASSTLVLRYRDDYRILAKTEDHARCVLKHLTKVLSSEYDLHLSSEKTQGFDDVFDGAFRNWMLEIRGSSLTRKIYSSDFVDMPNRGFLKDILVETYRIQKKYPAGRASVSLLSKIVEGLSKDPDELKLRAAEIPEIVAMLRKLTLLREEVTPQAFVILDIVLQHVRGIREKNAILRQIQKVISGNSDQAYQLIWFYRLCLSHAPTMCEGILADNEIPLLRVVSRDYYDHDYEIFEGCTYTAAQATQMEKFFFVDRARLAACAEGRLSIDPDSINPFKYSAF